MNTESKNMPSYGSLDTPGTLEAARSNLDSINRKYLIDQIMVLVKMGIETYGNYLDMGATVEEAVQRTLDDTRIDTEGWFMSFQPVLPQTETTPCAP
jgi:hypothetical protein